MSVFGTAQTGLTPLANFRCMKDLEPPRQMRARLAIALGYFTGITLIVGWSLPEGGARYRRAELAMQLPDTRVSGEMAGSANLIPATGRTRSKMNCAGCGVVESMRTIDMRDEFTGGCEAGQLGRSDVSGNVFAAGGRDDESLADTVSATIARENGVKKVAVTVRHQIVVRFPDGTTHVFDEAAPRTLRVGDQITVVGGLAGATLRRS